MDSCVHPFESGEIHPCYAQQWLIHSHCHAIIQCVSYCIFPFSYWWWLELFPVFDYSEQHCCANLIFQCTFLLEKNYGLFTQWFLLQVCNWFSVTRELGVVVLACNSSTWEAEAGELRVQGQLVLHSKTLSQKVCGKLPKHCMHIWIKEKKLKINLKVCGGRGVGRCRRTPS
jgi:hypothetical protein